MNHTTAFGLRCGQRSDTWLSLVADVHWDNFPQFAEHLAILLESQILSREWAADLHVWYLDFEGSKLSLNYETNSDSLWLALDRDEDIDTLDFLEALLRRKLGKADDAS